MEPSAMQVLQMYLGIIFFVQALAMPLFDAQTCLPISLYPDDLVYLKQCRHTLEYDDYLTREKPNFFVGLAWYKLVILWPLSLLNLYAIVASKPWLNTTCIIYGVSILTSTAAILPELVWSGRAPEKLLGTYICEVFLGGVIFIRGLIPSHRNNGASSPSTIPKRPPSFDNNIKKKV
ncbi:hypothetical protein Tsubulata_041561 [Turnera subulata]|uniref:EXPERA domain-containing protein n=1 Tax=Turnera subulata TaxID=218843 RepID=A0A9Q0JM75_9ROSI|nr:hypothetical protein Tsubulata_041561 [Turnera subulata]